MRRAIIMAVALGVASPSVAADDFDWNRASDRAKIDSWLRALANQCTALGFRRAETPAPDVMEKRIYSRLLLKSSYEADAEMLRWADWIGAVQDLQDEQRIAAAADRGGAALTAAAVDPSSHEAARERFVAASVDPLRPLLAACTGAAADDFTAANYLSGTGSLAEFELKASESFDHEVEGIAAYARELEDQKKAARK